MFCPNCGNKNEDGVILCSFCGTKIQDMDIRQDSQTQTYNYVFQGGCNAGDAVTPMPPMPKTARKIDKLMIASIIEAGVVVLMIAAFILVGRNTYDYDKVAEQYFLAVQSGDWGGAYDKLDITESEFIDKEHYIAVNSENTATQINQFNIIEENDSGMIADVIIQYTEKGSSGVSSMAITLNKQSGKHFLFFDDWKVSSSQLISQNYTVIVPYGAELYLDGEQVPSSMLSSKDENYSYTYVIPEIFNGSHELTIKIGDFTGTPEQVYVWYDEANDYIDSLTLTEQQQEELITLAYKDFQELINAGIAGDDFSAVSDIYSADAVNNARREYENYYLKHFVSSGEEEGIVGISLSEVYGDFSYSYIDGSKFFAEIKISYDYIVQFMDYDWWYQNVEEETYNSFDYIYLSFVYEDGEWKLQTYGMPYFSH